ncbi:MAG: methionyl-tRNA formyltransferase [Pedobacter sp.]|nr:MAG: methionyl-tRNA formyltransferase [Pedobacter sp.]
MNIIFMGTPDFAVISLDALVQSGRHTIVGVVTAPDKPAGRGQKLSESAVKKYALQKGLPIFQPTKLKDPSFLEQLKSLNADLQVVVAFRMLPEVVWAMPPKGTINLHASLLPQYRGAAPINWAIINGERVSGVSTFLLKQEIDTGDILFSEQVGIPTTYTAGDLHNELMQVGAQLLVKTVQAIENNNYIPTPQSATLSIDELKHAPKIFKEDCLIDWNQPVQVVYNHIRGLSPHPTAFSYFQDKTLKLFHVDIDPALPQIKPGQFNSDGKTFLKFACLDGLISVKELQLEGKKRMFIEEFLRGIRL